jgi:uncharacterized membrane protein YphA (DoxX/SURF4 family)
MVDAWRRALTRFGFSYWLLFCVYIVPEIFDVEAIESIRKVWDWLGLLVGHHLLGITDEIRTATTGSGDRTIDWLVLLAIVLLSTIATGVWTLVDSKGRHDERVRELVRVAMRYTLGFVIMTYGFAKMSSEHGQFPPPGVGRMVRTYGESSPMGILWTFMGTSQAYVKFSGLAEILGGALVLFRRTTFAGALVLIGVMLNVVLLNFCYDVPVKINSAHYLVMAVVLLGPDLRRLVDVVLLRRAVAAPPPLPVRRFRGRRLPVVLAKTAVIGTYLVLTYLALDVRTGAPTRWFDGWWEVSSFQRNGQPVPAVIDDKTRWRRIKFETTSDRSLMRWHNMDGSFGELLIVAEITEHSVSFKTAADDKPVTTYTFALAHPDADHMTLTGKVGTDELVVTFHRLDAGQMRLLNRGFHWISEVPFNR